MIRATIHEGPPYDQVDYWRVVPKLAWPDVPSHMVEPS